MRNSSLRRSLAAGASIAVAAAGFAAFAPSASAASASVTYNCTLLGGFLTSNFTTVSDTNVPATVALGSSTPIGFSATITVPAATAGTARALGDKVAGTASIATTINGVAAPASATIPSTPLGTAGDLVLTISGSGTANYVADTAGVKTIKAPSYTADLVFTNSSTGGTTPVDVNCTAATGADTTVDTFTVTDPNAPAPTPTPTPTPTPAPAVQASTTKVLKANYKKKAKKLVTRVQVRNEDKTAAAGDVKLVLKKGNKKVGKTVTVTLNKKGKAKHVFTKISKKGKYTLKANYKGADLSKRSKTTYTIKIK
ncbi:hypothetical protein [Nocardioides houyundeii]|uniref:hypothetical protein n=1 Tax=Nocardioides houyundeii TaxID=2045452 RepID=UPI000DF3439B|nr:hypothetical protein [Nocardioides houyundeii]